MLLLFTTNHKQQVFDAVDVNGYVQYGEECRKARIRFLMVRVEGAFTTIWKAAGACRRPCKEARSGRWCSSHPPVLPFPGKAG